MYAYLNHVQIKNPHKTASKTIILIATPLKDMVWPPLWCIWEPSHTISETFNWYRYSGSKHPNLINNGAIKYEILNTHIIVKNEIHWPQKILSSYDFVKRYKNDRLYEKNGWKLSMENRIYRGNNEQYNLIYVCDSKLYKFCIISDSSALRFRFHCPQNIQMKKLRRKIMSEVRPVRYEAKVMYESFHCLHWWAMDNQNHKLVRITTCWNDTVSILQYICDQMPLKR